MKEEKFSTRTAKVAGGLFLVSFLMAMGSAGITPLSTWFGFMSMITGLGALAMSIFASIHYFDNN